VARLARSDAAGGRGAAGDDPFAHAPLPTAARTAAQLEVLAHDGIRLQGPVWAGQTGSVALKREAPPRPHERNAQGAEAESAAVVFSARLAFDLPNLGATEIHLRLAGATIAVTVRNARRAQFSAALPQLGEQFAQRGLQPVSLQAVSP
jgi:hypothetical protein